MRTLKRQGAAGLKIIRRGKRKFARVDTITMNHWEPIELLAATTALCAVCLMFCVLITEKWPWQK